VLVCLALVSLLLGVFAATGGGFGANIAGLRVSLHNPTNPLLAAALLGVVGVRLAGAARAGRLFGGVSQLSRAGASWAATALALGVLGGTATFGAFVAGGADSSGYLSQARLWRSRTLTVETPLARELEFGNGEQPFAPLGYRPARTPGAVVPSYPPGFPLMLAAAGAAGLDRVLVPLTAAGLVWLSFLLGRRLGGPAVGLVAAAAAAGSPIVWYQGVQPMSDVPAAFWWTLSVVLLLREQRWAALSAGLAASAAALVRPNLYAVAPLLALCALWWDRTWRDRVWKTALFSLPVVPSALGFTAFQRVMYGSATETGYGGVTFLFSLDHVLPNLARYPAWMISTHSPFIVAALAAPIVAGQLWDTPADRARATRIAWSGLLFFAALLAFYALYFVFEEWVYVRFLLPALPWVFALLGVSVVWACRRLPPELAGVAVLAAALMVTTWGIGRARGVGAFRLIDSEHRYVDVADFVRACPPESVFLAMQHSGSLAYYTGRPLLRWDWIEPAELDRTLVELSTRGRPVYAVLEDWEEPQVRERFRGTRLATLPDAVFSTGVPEGIKARVYEITGTTALASAARVSR
jgi:hypothetical protein